MEPLPPSRRRHHPRRLLPLLAALAACATPPPPLQLEAPPALFFEARSSDAPGLIYLLGSVHVGERPLWLGPRLDAAFRASEELVVEVDAGEIDPAWFVDLLQREGTLAPLQSLSDVVSPEVYAAFQAYAKKRRLATAGLEHMRPWAVAMVIQEHEFARRKVRAEHGVETFFLARARDALPIRSLETAEEQIEVLSELTPDQEEMLLADALAGAAAPRASGGSDPLLDAWARGDAAGLEALLFGSLREHPELAPFYERTFFARNETMAAELAELARDGRTRFCIIGAGHVVGQRSVPDELRARGFTVERVAP